MRGELQSEGKGGKIRGMKTRRWDEMREGMKEREREERKRNGTASMALSFKAHTWAHRNRACVCIRAFWGMSGQSLLTECVCSCGLTRLWCVCAPDVCVRVWMPETLCRCTWTHETRDYSVWMNDLNLLHVTCSFKRSTLKNIYRFCFSSQHSIHFLYIYFIDFHYLTHCFQLLL